jgi:hypothetical protein
LISLRECKENALHICQKIDIILTHQRPNQLDLELAKVVLKELLSHAN